MSEQDLSGVPQPSPTTPPTTDSGFRFNRPTIISLLYLSTPLLGISGLIGLVLAYVWRNEPHEDWEASHYAYLIRTFWIALAACAIGILLALVLVGFLLLLAVPVLVIVRCVLSLVNAQKQAPMPNPLTLIA